MNFLSFFFYLSTALSSHTVDGRQMYFGGSIIGKASTISEIVNYLGQVDDVTSQRSSVISL